MDRPGVFIKLPEGFQEYDVGGTEMVGELQKALYLWPQAGASTVEHRVHRAHEVHRLLYTPLEADACVFK